MLRALSIRDFVIVDRLDLEFEAGFTVLTGETGAGKSILIDALALVLGERSDAGVVREGCARAEISAEFDIDATARCGAVAGSERSGRARPTPACCGGCSRAAGARALTSTDDRARCSRCKELGEKLVDIHGQHEHQSLLRAACAARAARRVCRRSRSRRRGGGGMARVAAAARASALELEKNAAALAAERERLRVAGAGARRGWPSRPRNGSELQADHRRLAHAASLIEVVEQSMEMLSEGEAAAWRGQRCDLAPACGARLRPGLKEILDVLEPAQIQLQEAVYSLRHYRQRARARSGAAARSRATPRSGARDGAQVPRHAGAIAGAAGRGDATAGATRRRARAPRRWRRKSTQAREAYLAIARKLSEERAREAARAVRQGDRGDADAGDGRRPLRGRAGAARRGQRARSGAGRVSGGGARRRARRGRSRKWPRAASCRA